MTDIEWRKLEQTVAQMTPEEKARLVALVKTSAAEAPASPKRSLLGLLADEPELADQIVEDAYSARQRDPLRFPGDG